MTVQISDTKGGSAGSNSTSQPDLDPFAVAVENRLAELLVNAEVRTAMVMVRHFTMPFRGVKLIAVDLVRTLRRAGVKVTLATDRSDAELRAVFPDIDDIVVFEDDLRPMMGRSFDLVMTHGWTTAGLVLLECQVVFRYLVLCSFSSFVPGEVIFGFEEQADALLFESEHNMEAQAPSLTHCAAPRLSLRNALATEWFTQVTHSSSVKPTRVAIVSNYETPELLALVPLLENSGSKVEIVGRAGEVRLFDVALTESYDLIISIGATVQKALVRGVPVFCYDHFGGPGYITQDNIVRAEHFNFSGRCSYNRRDANTLFEEITQNYSALREQLGGLCKLAQTRYCIPERLSELVGLFSRREQMRSFSDPKYNNLRRLLHLQANNAYLTPIFSVNYMVSAGEKPQLRMIEFVPSSHHSIEAVTVQEKSPFLFMGDQDITFRFRLLAKFYGNEEFSRVFVREAGKDVHPVKEFYAVPRGRYGVTDLRAGVSYPINQKTEAFRVFAACKDAGNVELLRVRFHR